MAHPDLLSLIFTYLIVSSVALIMTCNGDPGHGDHEFSYEEGSPSGPHSWGSLSPDWKTCADGKTQSPINLDSKKAKDQPNDLKKSYKEAPAKLFNKGHNIVVQWEGDAGGIEVNGSTYKLVQCHWHTPSEHTIDGKKYDAELHFVHKNDKDQLAVVGVLFEIGQSDPFINRMTESKFRGLDAEGSDLGTVSASDTTNGNEKYFRYVGSLTTPPCSEGVTWTVAQKPKTMSSHQIHLLKGTVDHEFQENARPVQELNGRTITQFEDKGSSGTNTGHNGTRSTSPPSSTTTPPSTTTTSTTSPSPSPTSSSASSSVLQLWSGIIIFIQIYILFLF